MQTPVEIYNRVRELVKDPQHGSADYGRLGALPIPYRAMIHDLCDYAESMDKMIMTAFNKDVILATELFHGDFYEKYAVVEKEDLEKYVKQERELKRIRQLVALLGVKNI